MTRGPAGAVIWVMAAITAIPSITRRSAVRASISGPSASCSKLKFTRQYKVQKTFQIRNLLVRDSLKSKITLLINE